MADDGELYRELDGLYGKLDRLLEKRAPDVLAERATAESDFPLLTDVVADDIPVRYRSARVPEVGATAPESAPAPHMDPELAIGGAEPAIPEGLMAAVEARLFDVLARHQQEVDAAVRRIVQEELARRQGR